VEEADEWARFPPARPAPTQIVRLQGILLVGEADDYDLQFKA
jgi:hypothetical protein